MADETNGSNESNRSNRSDIKSDIKRFYGDLEGEEARESLTDFGIDTDVPHPPKLTTRPIPPLSKPGQGKVEPGSYRNTALASQAATSFIAPIIILGLVGWMIDGKLHTSGIAIVVGFILGFVVGVSSLLRIVNRMNDEGSPKK